MSGKKSGSKKNAAKKSTVKNRAAKVTEVKKNEALSATGKPEAPKKQEPKDLKQSKAVTKKEKAAKNRKASFRRFFNETKAEFHKIVWPGPNQVLRNTIVVLVMIVVIGAIIWILDAGSSALLNTFLRRYS